MKKILLLSIIGIITIVPNVVKAETVENNNLELVAETIKYYKTTSYNSNYSLYSANQLNHPVTTSVEITKEEYENSDQEAYNTLSAYVETNYKKMTTSIYKNGSFYRYKLDVDWKTMPSSRSYDIIGIGMNKSVTIASSIFFNQYYCFSNGECKNNSAFYSKKTSTGGGASFKLPSGGLTVLKSTLYFDVKKNVSATILQQNAYGDYSHATSSINSSNSQNYNIGSIGISLANSITKHYDNISVAEAIWDGNW